MAIAPDSNALPRPSLEALRRKTVDYRGLGEVRLLRLEDGAGRGQRLLMLRNAAGLTLEVAVDRGFDLAALTWRGLNLGWNGPNGPAWPSRAPEADGGLAMLRGFDGFLVTCGLDHYGLPTKGPADHFLYPHRTTVDYPLHGRIGAAMAKLHGYGIVTDTDDPFLWCEAEVSQSTLGGELLVLTRRIEMPLFDAAIALTDRVENRGWRPTRHGMLYHINFGFPLLDEGTILAGDFDDRFIAAFDQAPPVASPDVVETFDIVPSMADAAGITRLQVRNPTLGGGVEAGIEYLASALPGLGVWRSYQSGIYALGIEPHSGLPADSLNYHGPGTPHFLEPGDTRDFGARFTLRPLV